MNDLVEKLRNLERYQSVRAVLVGGDEFIGIVQEMTVEDDRIRVELSAESENAAFALETARSEGRWLDPQVNRFAVGEDANWMAYGKLDDVEAFG